MRYREVSQALICLCLSLVAAALSGRPGPRRALVVIPQTELEIKFSLYLNSLRDSGFELDVVHTLQDSTSIELYENIALLSGGLRAKQYKRLLQFIDRGGNILIAVDEFLTTQTRDFLQSCGVAVLPNTSVVVDHSSYALTADSPASAPDHSIVLARGGRPFHPPLLPRYGRPDPAPPVAFRGIALYTPDSSVLATTVLRARHVSSFTQEEYQQSVQHGTPISSGLALCTAVQARNNARVVAAGSVDMFSNALMAARGNDGSAVGNGVFCHDISMWAFAQTGVIRYRNISHAAVDGGRPDTVMHGHNTSWELPESMYPDPEASKSTPVYRVKDQVVYSMIVEEFTGYEGGVELWRPFEADDIQMEFVMLEPYVRRTLARCREGDGCVPGQYSVKFTVPDTHGVFKLRVQYRRRGLSVLHAEEAVLVRPLKHNEFERFIPAAYPYYVSVFSLMVGFLLLTFMLMFTK